MDDDHCGRCDAPIAVDLLMSTQANGLCEACIEELSSNDD